MRADRSPITADHTAAHRAHDAPAGVLLRLIEGLATADLRYCHWKSSISFERVMSGEGDLDLLVDRADAGRFEGLLGQFGFLRAVDARSDIPSVHHFYGLDPDSGALLHLHVYYRLMGGESLLKNYHFPVERLLLEGAIPLHGMPVPRPEAELPVLVLRTILKYSSVIECALVRRGGKDRRGDLEALAARASAPETRKILRQWLPQVSPDLYERSLASLLRPSGTARKILLGRRVRRALRGLRRHTAAKEMALRIRLLAAGVARRALRLRGTRRLATGGAVIAFTGPETRGRSMVVRSTADWLGGVFRVRSIRWSSRSSWRARLLSLLPANDSAFVLGWLTRRLREGDVMARLRIARRHASSGALVLCDGYGSTADAPPDIEIRLEGAIAAPPEEEDARRSNARVVRIDTSGPAEETVRSVRLAVWTSL